MLIKVKILYDTIMVNTYHYTHLSKSTECTMPRMNPYVDYILMKIMCQRRFSNCNTNGPLWWGVLILEKTACVEA